MPRLISKGWETLSQNNQREIPQKAEHTMPSPFYLSLLIQELRVEPLSYACFCLNAEGMKLANIMFRLWDDEKREKKNERRKEDRMGTKRTANLNEVRL
jgi:hypothetical protein